MKSQIIITYGPACQDLRILKKIISEKTKIVRINTKYISMSDYAKIREKIMRVKKIKIMVDIKKRSIIKKILNEKFDYLAVSFAENPSEIVKIRKMFNHKIKIISKVETKKGVENIDGLIKVSDGIMIARGDLGESMAIEKIPMIQKMINKKCNSKKIISITATEMMSSMTKNRRPTRAEVTDVANAILEGSEYLLLAEETAIGKYPAEAVKIMEKIIKETEKHKKEFK